MASLFRTFVKLSKSWKWFKDKKYAKPRILTIEDAKIMLLEQYQNIYIDLLKNKDFENINLINDSCMNMNKYLKNNSVDGIIFLHHMQIVSIIQKFTN